MTCIMIDDALSRYLVYDVGLKFTYRLRSVATGTAKLRQAQVGI